MQTYKSAFAVIFSGAMLVTVTPPVWSQEVPGEHRQPEQNLTRPGDNEDIPGMRGQGTPELSPDNMRLVEQALKSKGYDPGPIDGVADNANRAAIRSFQKDNNIPITGAVDKRTAEKLDVSIDSQSSTTGRASSHASPKSEGRSQGRDADENIPRNNAR